MIIRQDRLGMEKERRNVRRRNAAGAAVEEADRTHLPSHRRSMVNWTGVVGVAQLVERRSVAPNVAGSSPVSHPNFPIFLITPGFIHAWPGIHQVFHDFFLFLGFRPSNKSKISSGNGASKSSGTLNVPR